MRLLMELARRPGDLVSIDDLLETVWSGVTVNPDSVYQAIAGLRPLLGDDPRDPRIIATVPRLGYRLIATVACVPDNETPAAPHPGRRLVPGLGGGAAIAVAALAWAFIAFRPPQPVSVAPLILLDMSSTFDQGVLTEDLTERLASRLALIPGIRTPGFRASLALRGKHLRPVEAARLLNVAYVVDGAVHTEGDGFRIAMRLIRRDSGFVVWSQDYPVTKTSALTVQDAIADDVARAVGVKPRHG